MAISIFDRLFGNTPLQIGSTVLGWQELVPPEFPQAEGLQVEFEDGGQVRYLLLEMSGYDPLSSLGKKGKKWYKAVFPAVLEYLPRQMREQVTVLQRFAACLKGLYNARMDLLAMVAGMFGQLGEEPRGLVQAYAAQAYGETPEEAIRRGKIAYTALLATLRSIPQARFVPMKAGERDFFQRAYSSFPHILVAVGQPDPRMEGTRAFGERAPGIGPEEETLEQNELIYRGLQALGLDFANLTLATCVGRHTLFRLQQRFREEATTWLSRIRGTRSISLNFSLPVFFSGVDTSGRTTGYEASRQQGISLSQMHSEGTSESTGYTKSVAHTTGTTRTETTGTTHTEGESWGTMSSSGGSRTETTGTAHTDGMSHETSTVRTTGGSSTSSVTTGRTVTEGRTEISTTTTGESTTHTDGKTVVDTQTKGVIRHSGDADAWSASMGTTKSHAEQRGTVNTDSYSRSIDTGGDVSFGIPGIAGFSAGGKQTTTGGHGTAHHNLDTDTQGENASLAFSYTHTYGTSRPDTHTTGTNTTSSDARTDSSSTTTGVNVHHSEAVIVDQRTASSTSMHSLSRGEADSTSASDTTSHAVTLGTTWASGSTHERSVSDAVSQSSSVAETEQRTEGEAWSRETSRSVADMTGRAETTGTGLGSSLGLVSMHSGGITTGLTGGLSLVKSYEWNDATAQMVAEILKRQLVLLDQMTLSGAFLTQQFWFAPDERTAEAIRSLFVTAFFGQTDGVVTPARVRLLREEEKAYVRLCALGFQPSLCRERAVGVFEGLAHSNLLPMEHLAALTAPAIMEGGRAVTTKEAIPPYAIYGPGFYRDPPDKMVAVGRHISFEVGEALRTVCFLPRERMGHIGIFGDSGYGKSEAAINLISEINRKWDLPAVIFDWGLDYRKLARDIPPDRFFFRSLYPDGPCPIRWNPLQFIRDLDPEEQMAMIVDVLANAGGLGERQKGFLRETLRKLYLDVGALTFDREQVFPPADALLLQEKAVLSSEEEAVLEAEGFSLPPPVGGKIWLRDLSPEVRRVLASLRSAGVGIRDWYNALERQLRLYESKNRSRDVEVIQGILNRLNALAYGRLADMYAALQEGEKPLDLTREQFPNRVVVLEGGPLGETEKAILFGWMIGQTYLAAIARYRRSLGTNHVPEFLLVIEEANKVVVPPTSLQDGPIAQTSQLFSSLARDSRKYGIYLVWLAQSPSALPPEIISCCVNFLIFRQKIGPDRQRMVEAMAKVAAGLVEPEYIKHLSRLPVGWAVCILGKTLDEVLVEPSLVQSFICAGSRPSDVELAGRVSATSSSGVGTEEAE